MREKQYAVYILTNKRNGTLYIGVTNNLKRRVYEHREKATRGFTERYGLSKLIYYELGEDVRSAIHRETCLKRWKRSWKIEIIEKMNPTWKDLYFDI